MLSACGLGEAEEPDQYFIGRALSIKKIYTERAQVGRTRYDAGDVEIEVEWFQRDVSGGDERRIFRSWSKDVELGDQGMLHQHCTLASFVLSLSTPATVRSLTFVIELRHVYVLLGPQHGQVYTYVHVPLH